MSSRSSFKRVPSQLIHEQLTKLRAELGVLKVKLELRGALNAQHVPHVDAADAIAGALQSQLLPPFEAPTKPAVATDTSGWLHATNPDIG